MFTNADITIYQYSKLEGKEKYTKLPIEGVFWDDVKQSNTLKTGQVNADSVLLIIPLASLGGRIRFTAGKDIVVKDIIEDEMDCTDQRALSESLQRLKALYHFVTVTTVDEKLYGSEEVQHYELSCK